MEKIITWENLRNFAYCNDGVCQKPIRGIVISFFGLGSIAMFQEDTEEAIFYGENGILYLVPYNNPWAWMNPQAVAYTDELVDVLFAHYRLSEDTPIVSTGGSMGGLSALVYCRYAKRTPAACVANCPVCDLPYHFTERPDLPRTLYSAFFHQEGSMQEALEKASPLHLAKEMPPIPYRLFHCTKDQAVNLEKHSEVFTAAMEQHGMDIVLTLVPDRGHCDLTPEMWAAYRNEPLKFIG